MNLIVLYLICDALEGIPLRAEIRVGLLRCMRLGARGEMAHLGAEILVESRERVLMAHPL